MRNPSFKLKTAIKKILPHLKPAAITVGAHKAGTTALYHYLSCHFDVSSSTIKEIDFFGCNGRYVRGLEFYHSHFPPRTLHNFFKKTFDISPSYLGLADKAAARIHAYNPKIKLIVLLRDPVKRAFSAWQMAKQNIQKKPNHFEDWHYRCDKNLPKDYWLPRSSKFGESFETDVVEEINALNRGERIAMSVVEFGVYIKFLQYYFERFSREQILIICTENMKKNTVAELRKVEKFTGLRPYPWTANETKPFFEGGYTEEMSLASKHILESFYAPYNEKLYNLLGQRFEWD